MKNYVRTWQICALLVIVIIVFSSCANQTTMNLTDVETDRARTIWGSRTGIDVSLGDIGMFYSEDQRIRYYDMESMRSYVLCNSPNCSHNSEKCSAFFPTNVFNETVQNVAQIDGYIYCTYANTTYENINNNEIEKNIQLLQIDITDGTRKVVASFPGGYNVAEEDFEYYATNIGRVDYCNGYAWLSVDMQEFNKEGTGEKSFTELCGVNLENGDIITLNDNDGYQYRFSSVCPDTVYFYRSKQTEIPLTQEEFFEEYQDSQSVTVKGNTFTSYHDYIYWQSTVTPNMYEWFSYSIASDEVYTLASGETIPRDGYQEMPIYFLGEYEGKAYCEEKVNDQKTLYLLDCSTGEKQVIRTIKNGGALRIAQGSNANLIFPDGRLFYSVHSQDTCSFDSQNCTADIYVYDCNSGEETYLFTDNHNITFRIYGEYNGGFFGKQRNEQGEVAYYWISEENFYAGNLNAAVKHKL